MYLKDEWTDYSDIGKKFEGAILTLDEYLKTEDAYIQAVFLLMKCLNIEKLKLTKLINHARYQKQALIDGKKIINDTYYDHEMIVFIIQAILRNKLGCKLEFDNTMYVHFGWDYYMYIGSAKACQSTIQNIDGMGLFVEPFVSPYLEEDDE